MSVQRLTAPEKYQIESVIIKHGFEKREQAVQQKKHELAGRVYDYNVSDDWRILMQNLPEGIIGRTTEVRVELVDKDGTRHTQHLSLISPRLMPDKFRHWGSKTEMQATDDLKKEIKSIFKQEKELDTERREMRSKISGILKQCNSVKRLLEIWPEVSSLVQNLKLYSETPAGKSVAIDTRDLNKRMGLPPKTEAASQPI